MARPEFPIFEMSLARQRRGKWTWSVSIVQGTVVMRGRESSRPAAKYRAERALFMLLLTAPYRSRLSA
ncbi:hypothetical protein FBZ96_109332 [Bradyrhizobium stylosanthis]|uniref:DUF1508 domain-containing protein n=1 Tax=Bradyrhizobium stylosanthis TaxID=1803665 RepID=A0A560DA02_9BRAD|nr:hypothetical protein FBZ96_109332 [Bradyrhizobium stylosanthis]